MTNPNPSKEQALPLAGRETDPRCKCPKECDCLYPGQTTSPYCPVHLEQPDPFPVCPVHGWEIYRDATPSASPETVLGLAGEGEGK